MRSAAEFKVLSSEAAERREVEASSTAYAAAWFGARFEADVTRVKNRLAAMIEEIDRDMEREENPIDVAANIAHIITWGVSNMDLHVLIRDASAYKQAMDEVK